MKTSLGRAAFVAAACVWGGEALALEVTRSADSPAAPDALWDAVGDFCGIADWHPVVTSCSMTDGDPLQRTLQLDGGGTIVEALVSRDDAARTYTYRILESPLPVANYESTIAVSGAGDGSSVTWSGTFDAAGASDADAEATMAGVYEAGVDGIVAAAAP